MKTLYNINEGLTLDYLIHGVATLVGGGICLAFFWPLGLLLILFAFALFGLSAGIEIDVAQKQIRTFHGIAGFKIGSWLSLQGYETAILKLERERNFRNPLPVADASGINYTRKQLKSFELVFVSPDNREFSFHEFIDYPKAHKVVKILRKGIGLDVTDEFEEVHKKSLERRKNRERGSSRASRR